MFDEACQLIATTEIPDAHAERILAPVGFSDWRQAYRRLREVCLDENGRRALADCLPMLLTALSDTATPDGSLVNFERYAQSVPDRARLFEYLSSHPRAVEILMKLFVGSQFLTEILLRHPDYLERLTNHKQLADFKSRKHFLDEAHMAAARKRTLAEKFDALRRFQRWELLRLGACDSFRLFDLKSVTVQLSLLADSLVQCCLSLLADDMHISPTGFAVLAFGKLGGEELNYSSDIDLVFLTDGDPTRYWTLGQRLIKALMESTAEGFLYRVDMRLRPWGRSGSLVNSVDAHRAYLKQHGMQWEKQALLKARVIAGDFAVGEGFLQSVQPLLFDTPREIIRQSIREMKDRIEADLERQGRKWGEVKSGAGSIRDVEFVTQYLQLAHGGENPHVRSINTLDGLVRLADFGYLRGDEFRRLSTGYVFLRTIEHSLQLMHHKQTHSLPNETRELAYLARRLDFPAAEQFLDHYHRHCETIRAIYERYIEGEPSEDERATPASAEQPPDHRALMEPSYSTVFTDEQIARHETLLQLLSAENPIEVETERLADGNWRVTFVGLDHPGDLSRMCGLLFAYGFNIIDGNVFTAEQVTEISTPSKSRGKKARRKSDWARRFVDVFTVEPPANDLGDDVWARYSRDLAQLQQLAAEGKHREAQGQLAKHVSRALRDSNDVEAVLLPVDIEIDNGMSERSTVLRIEAEDTKGFLFELTNALALAGINISRVIVNSVGTTVFDTLYVTDQKGEKITDPVRQKQLRAAIVLIKHYTHLLPRSPNPEAALLHFRDFLEQLFEQPDWHEELASLENFDVLEALTRLLGVSNFLWEDFLRLQHENLFPVVRDVKGFSRRKTHDELQAELAAQLASCTDDEARKKTLNAFKDREMFRTDMRHIVVDDREFGDFSAALTDVADVVVAAAYRICNASLCDRYGTPRLADGSECPVAVMALGKCGGRELGFASDIELMFVYQDEGKTDGRETITNTEYFLKLVESFTRTIEARQEGIFQIDLRLRPYGRAGSLAVSLNAFRTYFAHNGPAWPYERQALVKLRPVAGDAQFSRRIMELRDRLIYAGEPFDVAAMRAMREKQVLQLVRAGTTNAKLSSGGLVDIEYLVQGLQMTHGHRDKALRVANTQAAIAALHTGGILAKADRDALSEAYVFQRRLIDALRMVRGHAKDLTIPDPQSEEFDYLARRLGYRGNVYLLSEDIERHTRCVQELSQRLLSAPRT